MSFIVFQNKKTTDEIKLCRIEGEWLVDLQKRLSISNNPPLTLQQAKDDFEGSRFLNFELVWDNKPMSELWQFGLLKVKRVSHCYLFC